MVRKSIWMVMLLAALMMLSLSAAFAAGWTRTERVQLSTTGAAQTVQLKAQGEGKFKVYQLQEHKGGDCRKGDDSVYDVAY